VVENSLIDPIFANNPLVTGPPYVIFYAGAALVVGGVRVGSLCIIDNKPRKFGMKDRMNLLDLGSAVAELILERRRTFMNHNQERSSMMLSMMQGLRTPLFAVDLGMSVLQSEKEAIKKHLEATQFTNGKVFYSTIDDIYCSIQKLKMAVESTVVLGRAFAIPVESTGHAGMVVPQTLMSNAVFLDIDVCMSQMKMVATIIGGKRVEWNCNLFQTSMLELMTDKRTSVKSFPDGVNFIILTVLNHILAYDLSNHPISVEVSCVKCCRDEGAAGKPDESYCHICASSPTTVNEAHGNIIVTIKSRSLRNHVGNVDLLNGCGTENPELSLGELTLQSSVEKVLDSVGGRLTVNSVASDDALGQLSGARRDVFTCELPYLACVNLSLPTGRIETNIVPVMGISSVRLEPVGSIGLVDSKPAGTVSALPPLSDLQAGPQPTPESKLHVLIVDDSLMIQKMMKKWLEAAGCTVSCAVNGKVGVSMIQANKYDIMLLDFLMPVMLGLDALQQFSTWMKASPSNSVNQDMLVIGMSSTATEEEQRCGFECGMHFFSPKPVDLESLKRAIAVKKQFTVINECLDVINGELAGTPMVAFKEELELALSAPKGTNESTEGSQKGTTCDAPLTDQAKNKAAPRAFGNWSFFRKYSKVAPC
jgi:CheY-like chemotaxis protein